MQVRLLKAWRRMPVGKIFDPTPGVADVLMRRGLVTPVSQDLPKKKPVARK